MAGKKLSNESFLELYEREKEFQEETKSMDIRSKLRASDRISLIKSYGITVQNFYYRKKMHLKGLERREKLKLNLGEVEFR